MVCSKFPIFWKSYIGSALMVCPDADEWALHSANTKAFPIQSGNGETFIHTNKFLAKYPTKEKAVIAAFISLDKFKTR